MPSIPTEQAGGAPTFPYALPGDVTQLLGTIGNRLPEWIVVADFLDVAHGDAVEALGQAYPTGIPTFEGNGLTVVRWAEAKLAAAEILDAIRVNLPEDQHGTADALRVSALAALAGGVVGYLPGTTPVDPTDPTKGTAGESPRVSSFTPLSAFEDPYAAARAGDVNDDRVWYQ